MIKKFKPFMISILILMGTWINLISRTPSVSGESGIATATLISSYPYYIQGDSMIFSYANPNYSATDRIGIFPSGTKPGAANPSIDWKYISSAQGTITFKTLLIPGIYDAYLLCCDGYDSISSCSFEILDANTASVTPVNRAFEAGSIIKIIYNDPSFTDGDWLAIYFDGDDPKTAPMVTWSKLVSKSGVVSFPAVLTGGDYIAILYCCNTTETEYARSGIFSVADIATGSYVKTSAVAYPEGSYILVNFKDIDFVGADWIGIYKDGDAPGGPQPVKKEYVLRDSGTIELSSIPLGDYVVYLFCCDGYTVKAKYNFKLVDSASPSLVSSVFEYPSDGVLDFNYNSPAFVATDWIGIYKPGEIPGGDGVFSTVWKYLPDASGEMTFTYPDDYPVDALALAPGEYWAGLFCCDAYGLYAMVTFTVSEFGTGIKSVPIVPETFTVFPNPGLGHFNISSSHGKNIQKIVLYTISGQELFQEKQVVPVNEKSLDLQLNKGMYFLEIWTENSKTTKKIIIQ